MKKLRNWSLVACMALLLFMSGSANAQTAKAPSSKPKLIVGIVIDQMRYDFLFRYWDKYGSGGFRRLVNEGYLCSNAQYNYFPTYTGPGHASIYTGSVPAINGIVSNNWYEKTQYTDMYVTDDATVQPVGTADSSSKMSPRNLLTTTITDQLRLSDNFQSKVIGISLKDRGAILPAGHTANAAYWFDDSLWVSSTYYMNALPKWVNEFNDKREPAKYLSADWKKLLPNDPYSESAPDTELYEGTFKGEQFSAFPHRLPLLKSNNYELIKATPFGNTITKDFAIDAIKNENMGKGAETDFLAVSFSSTDYVGHQYGPNSVETEDTYLRLDKDLADLLSFLDTWVGKENVLVFLTADHGVAPVPAYAQQHNIPAGLNNDAAIKQLADLLLQRQFNDTALITRYSNQQFFLDHTEMEKAGLTEQKIYDAIKPTLLSMTGIRDVILTDNLQQSTLPVPMIDMLRNSIYPKRCGDIIVVYDPYWFSGRPTGTTHGAMYSYDTHVPLLWYGWSIKQGSGSQLVHITDIAPTIADFLRIQEPNGNIGVPIQGLR